MFPALLEQLTPTAATYETGTFTGSGDGDVTGNVIPVDINLDPAARQHQRLRGRRLRRPGLLRAERHRAHPARHLPLRDKAVNAQAAGAEAVVIFNQGNTRPRGPDRRHAGTAGRRRIPVVGASFADGAALPQAGSTAHVRVLPSETRTDYNVIAEKGGTNKDNVVMAGAHLDSVEAGPGINDNGSGSAALLETALQMAKVKPVNTVRFAWWGAEEAGLVGSRSTSQGCRRPRAGPDRALPELRHGRLAERHPRWSTTPTSRRFPAPVGVPIPEGSEAIENLYERFYTSVDQPYDDAQFSGRSDYQAFIEAGIPSGGLFTGAEGVKTAEQATIWGGTAGAQFDPCYH